MATIACYALSHPRYARIAEIVKMGAPRDVSVHAAPRGQVSLHNHNRIIHRPVPGVPGALVDGMKTGFINESGACLVASATAEDWQLVAVLLNDKARFDDALTLFNYGFTQYIWKEYATAGQPVLHVPVTLGAGQMPLGAEGMLGAVAPRAGSPNDHVIFSGEKLRAPVRRGERVGELVLLRDGQPITSTPAVTLQTVTIAWWVQAGVALAIIVVALGLLMLANAIYYGTRAKNARRRRHQLQARRRDTD